MSRITTRELATAALFAALLAASALVGVPLGHVPFTLQIYVVLLIGLTLGPRLGLLSVFSYLILGLIAPVYSGGSGGLGALLGPTGGYLWGFPGAVAVTGLVAGRGKPHLARLLLAGAAGIVPVYAAGATWLGLQLDLTPSAALATGVAPFVWIDLIKAVAAALTARMLVSLPPGLPAACSGGR